MSNIHCPSKRLQTWLPAISAVLPLRNRPRNRTELFFFQPKAAETAPELFAQNHRSCRNVPTWRRCQPRPADGRSYNLPLFQSIAIMALAQNFVEGDRCGLWPRGWAQPGNGRRNTIGIGTLPTSTPAFPPIDPPANGEHRVNAQVVDHLGPRSSTISCPIVITRERQCG